MGFEDYTFLGADATFKYSMHFGIKKSCKNSKKYDKLRVKLVNFCVQEPYYILLVYDLNSQD